MELTNAMLQAAIDKAVEAGLLPKYVRKDESAVDREVMRLVLQAALQAEAAGEPSTGVTKRSTPPS